MKVTISTIDMQDAGINDMRAEAKAFCSRAAIDAINAELMMEDLQTAISNFEYLEGFCVFGVSNETGRYHHTCDWGRVENTQSKCDSYKETIIRSWANPANTSRGIGHVIQMEKTGDDTYCLHAWTYHWGEQL